MDNATLGLLKECDAGTKTAVNSFKEVLDDIKGEDLRQILVSSLSLHEKIGDELHEYLKENGEKGKEPNPMARAMSWMKINFKLMENKNDKTIASLMFDGCSMGVKQLSEYLNYYDAAESRAKTLAKRLIDEEEELGRRLKEYL